MAVAKKGVKGWSLKALAGRFREIKAEMDKAEVELACVKAECLMRIAPGATEEGLQHQCREKLVCDEGRLQELGHLAEVQSLKVDGAKVKALVKLHPEVVDLKAVNVEVSDVLVDRESHG